MTKNGGAIITTTNRLLINSHTGLYTIPYNNILYCKANSSYTEIHLVNGGKITYCKTLKQVENVLQAPNIFYRIHKSFLINKDFIFQLKYKPKPEVVLLNNIHVDVSFRKTGWLAGKLKEDR